MAGIPSSIRSLSRMACSIASPTFQLFNPLAFDVDTRQTENIRNLPEREGAAALTLIACSRQKCSQLPLTGCTLAL